MSSLPVPKVHKRLWADEQIEPFRLGYRPHCTCYMTSGRHCQQCGQPQWDEAVAPRIHLRNRRTITIRSHR